MMTMDGMVVDHTEQEFGIELGEGAIVSGYEHQNDAKVETLLMGGKVMVRDVYVGVWRVFEGEYES